MVALLDQDEDGSLARAEVQSFFVERAEGEGVWDFSGPGDDADDESMSGPAPGTMAPDFKLRPPDGGTAVRLSSFSEKLPVALIFGSYT
jgi:hypothetical protein